MVLARDGLTVLVRVELANPSVLAQLYRFVLARRSNLPNGIVLLCASRIPGQLAILEKLFLALLAAV